MVAAAACVEVLVEEVVDFEAGVFGFGPEILHWALMWTVVVVDMVQVERRG